MIQECVNNVIKHSGANQLDISLIRDGDGISATIEDNGKGFDSNKITQGNGLKNMKKRAEEIGARLLIESEPGKGTTVQLLLNLA